ncbi:hypothetical protein DID75_01735 [Candidatus Marinamargulisbacteria bacterium SCGC AG-410-N11]|nr:hypothetical protein DID75_01735 [Candidatus Marinamargulisbacteria bacterium SCGC AG-410-N11]
MSNMDLAKITTYVSSKEQVQVALKSGADHLILEHSLISIRSFSNNWSDTKFKSLVLLIKESRKINPNIELSVNCDLILQNKDIPLIQQLLDILKQNNLNQIIIQDPGLIELINEYQPLINIIFAQETGNLNLLSLNHYNKQCTTQFLSNEITISSIKNAKKKLSGKLGIHVQGPIMIQYSYRRFLKHSPNETISQEETIFRLAQDQQYPNRFYRFYDNPHGHFMYLYFDRCLHHYCDTLFKLNLDYWICDARGDSISQLEAIIKHYKKQQNDYNNNPSQYKPSDSDFDRLSTIIKRPLRPGFFRVNKTDKIIDNKTKKTLPNFQYIGTVIDVIKEKWMTIEINTNLNKKTTLLIINPEGYQIELNNISFRSLTGTISNECSEGLCQIKWQKKIYPKSSIFLKI